MMNSTRRPGSLIDVLLERAGEQGEATAYTFLVDGVREEPHTYARLASRMRALAATVAERAAAGDRVLLLYPAGVEFLAAFCACLAARTIAIPASAPEAAQLKRSLPRLRSILRDASPALVLTTDRIGRDLERVFAVEDTIPPPWIATETIADDRAGDWRPAVVAADAVAYLQYTSGSTSDPKGVMVTHGNLMANLADNRRRMRYDVEDCVACSWLPNFHDFGLVEGYLQPVYAGIPSFLLSPMTFLKRPERWLEAITRYRVTNSSAAVFGYAYCVDRIPASRRRGLDLSSWQMAIMGAEKVRPEVLDRFVEAYGPYGFRRRAFAPGYGLAETTLSVTLKASDAEPLLAEVSATALADHRVVEISSPEELAEGDSSRLVVGCGEEGPHNRVVLVDPGSGRRCAENEVGEVWVQGPSVAAGYWNRPEATAESFAAFLDDGSDGPFLRTGDLAFLRGRELFITGRIKEMLIIRGRNLYPQDLELSAEGAAAGITPGGCAAFAIEVAGEERAAIAVELTREGRQQDLQDLVSALRRAISEEHEIELEAVLVLRRGDLPKTSSGKIQRGACWPLYESGDLRSLFAWRADEPGEGASEPADAAKAEPNELPVTSRAAQPDRLLARIVALLADRARMPAESVDPRRPFAEYGLDSPTLVSVVGDLERELGTALDPGILYRYPSPERLAESLAGHLARDLDGTTPEPVERATVRESADREPIAVIGMGCRFPGADGPDAFWRRLIAGADAIRDRPADRGPASGADPGGFLDDVRRFDADFFGISPREAAQMDPQQRLVLEVAWQALEHAALAPSRLAGSLTGVFVGISGRDYERLQMAEGAPWGAWSGTGNATSIAANRLSYLLDLRGPSLAIDTACSSSLVAIYQACRGLRGGDCDLAVAGGVNLMLDGSLTAGLRAASMLAPDGRCKTFDAGADGYGRGEGCGFVILRRLADAERHRDPILALIHGAAINQDGRSNGLTAPNGLAQEDVIRRALADAGAEPRQVRYVEAHGTGTPLGDPVEVTALQNVLSEGRQEGDGCVLGSVKTHIGHLEAAAGVAGLIKTVLTIAHRRIPAHLHLRELNPRIDLDQRFTIPVGGAEWPGECASALAGVSSFGFGGTNAHVLLGPAPDLGETRASPSNGRHVLALSAHRASGLRTLAASFAAHLEAHPDLDPAALSATTALGRDSLTHRLAVTGRDVRELGEALGGFAAEGRHERAWTGSAAAHRKPVIAFVFTGQGAQFPGMGRELYQRDEPFRQVLDRCDERLRDRLRPSLLQVMLGDDEDRLLQTLYTQVSLFVLEAGLVKLLAARGITPAAVLGHSIGEYTAAWAAGVLSLDDALDLVYERGRLMQSLPEGGAMAAVAGGEAQVRAVLEASPTDLGTVELATVNGPRRTVISGDGGAVGRACARLEEAGLRSKPLRVSHAFHSSLMDGILDDFEAAAERSRFARPRLPLYSNLSGQRMDEAPDAAYWRRQLRSTVRFADGLEAMLGAGCDAVVEIGPRPVLTSLVRECNRDVACVPTLRGEANADLSETLAALFALGCAPEPAPGARGLRRLGGLPTHPFEGGAHWFRSDSIEISGPRLLRLDSLETEPALLERVRALTREHGLAAGSLSQVTGKNFLFLGSGERALLFCNRGVESLIAFDYTGAPEGFSSLAREFLDYAAELELEPQLLVSGEATPEELRSLGLSTTPIGAFQNLDVAGFTLNGKRMRRLRYAVSRYTNEGPCSSEEYEPRSDPAIDAELVEVIDAWASGKTLAPGLLDFMRTTVLTGTPYAPRHRIFLVRRQSRLDAAILLLPSARLDGYLMDIEFYRGDAPLGCLEYGIVSALEALGGEGTAVLSLGLTPGTLLEPHAGADEQAQALLLELHDQDLLNGDANLQFKNKFRPTTESVFFCRRSLAGRTGLQDLVLLLGDPFHTRRPELLGLPRPVQPAPTEAPATRLAAGETLHPLLQRRLHLATREVVFESDLTPEEPSWLGQHRIAGQVLMPASGFVDMAVAGASSIGFASDAAPTIEVTELFFTEALSLPPGGRRVQVVLAAGDGRAAQGRSSSDEGGQLDFEVYSRRGEGWLRHANGRLSAVTPPEPSPQAADAAPPAAPARRGEDLYGELAKRGYEYGAAFRGLRELSSGESRAVGRVQAPAGLGGWPSGLHPAVLDACFHVCRGLLPDDDETLYLPTEMRGVRWTGATSGDLDVTAELRQKSPQGLRVGLRVAAEDGAEILVCDEILLRAVTGRHARPGEMAEPGLYEVWQTILLPAGPDPAAPPRTWLLLAESPIARAVGLRLNDAGHRTVLRSPGEGPWTESATRLDADPLEVLYFAGFEDQEEDPCLGALEVIRQLLGYERSRAVRLWLAAAAVPRCGTLPGLAQVASRELGETLAGCVEVEAADVESAAARIVEEVLGRRDELCTTLRRGKRLGRRIRALEKPRRRLELDREGTYLITGGLGALGKHLARRLAERGAGSLALIGRREPGAEEQELVSELESLGAGAEILQADVADASALKRVLTALGDRLPPLRGIFHCAGVLDDGVLLHQTRERFERVLAPKVEGAWNLHALTREHGLDFFVLYSSIAGLLGNPGQSNYAAANTFLDALAEHRRSLGLAATSIAWGPWRGAGMGSVIADDGDATGLGALEPDAALDTLESLLADPSPPPVTMICPLSLPRLARSPLRAWPLFADLVAAVDGAGVPTPDGAPHISSASLRATPEEARRGLMTGYLRALAAGALGVASADVDADRPLNRMGLDSLMIMELRNRLRDDLAVEVPAVDLFDATVHTLASALLEQVARPEEPQPAASAADEAEVDPLADVNVDELSDEEVEALLKQLR